MDHVGRTGQIQHRRGDWFDEPFAYDQLLRQRTRFSRTARPHPVGDGVTTPEAKNDRNWDIISSIRTVGDGERSQRQHV